MYINDNNANLAVISCVVQCLSLLSQPNNRKKLYYKFAKECIGSDAEKFTICVQHPITKSVDGVWKQPEAHSIASLLYKGGQDT